MAMVTLTLKGELELKHIKAVCREQPEEVKLNDHAREALQKLRDAAEKEIGDGSTLKERPIYGFNRGFGSNVRFVLGDDLLNDDATPEERKRVRTQARLDLQRNLILSHAANVGPMAPKDVVRATMLFRAQSLARGRSTVRPDVVDALLRLLNDDITPAVPRFGSVSASGDLSPLSHIAAVLIGKGCILLNKAGRKAFSAEHVSTEDYMAHSKEFNLPELKPIELQMKEGLALNNGCQWSTAWALLTTMRMSSLVDTACLATALTLQAMVGSGRPFREDFHALRPHPGSVNAARWIFSLLEGYTFQNVTADVKNDFDGELQDPYNLRCAAQVLGPCVDLIERAKETLLREANSVTDNPVDLNNSDAKYTLDEIVSGGHFHGMPVAVEAYGLLQAAGIMARLSNMRCVRYVDAARNKGLGPQMRGDKPKATESGLLIAEYSTAGLCNHIWGLAMPTHMMSMSTDSGQEDHVSMAANVAMRAHEAAERLAEILAVELAFASQALDQRQKTGVVTRALDPKLGAKLPPPQPIAWKGSQGGKVTEIFEKKWQTPLPKKALAPGQLTKGAIEAIRETFPLVKSDRELSWDMMALAEKVLSGEIVEKTGYAFERH
jgi:histidine ammonia-lyase